MKTNLDMITATLNILGVVGAGQTVQAEDEAAVRDYLTAVIASLDKKSVCSLWANYHADEYPDEFYSTLPKIVANAAACHYGLGADRQILDADAQDAIQDILSTKETERGKQPDTALYY